MAFAEACLEARERLLSGAEWEVALMSAVNESIAHL